MKHAYAFKYIYLMEDVRNLIKSNSGGNKIDVMVQSHSEARQIS